MLLNAVARFTVRQFGLDAEWSRLILDNQFGPSQLQLVPLLYNISDNVDRRPNVFIFLVKVHPFTQLMYCTLFMLMQLNIYNNYTIYNSYIINHVKISAEGALQICQ